MEDVEWREEEEEVLCLGRVRGVEAIVLKSLREKQSEI